MTLPPGLLFAKTHEWARLETTPAGEIAVGQIATVGITQFAVEALTDLVFLQLPKVGKTVTAGQPFGEIESVKAVSDLYAPVTGEIIEVNTQLPEHLETLNTDPYQKGWIAKIRVTEAASSKGLMAAEAYERQCAEEGH